MRIPYPLREPWAITEPGLQAVLAVWSRGEAFAEALTAARQYHEQRTARRIERKRAYRDELERQHATTRGKRARAALKARIASVTGDMAALMAHDGEPLKNTRTVVNREGVAVIPIEGPLFRHASMFDEISGATSYETIRRDFQAALERDDIFAIVLDIDSPGGEVHGCSELSKAIFAARGRKPIVAYAGGMMCSAAYWIGSAADRIVVDPAAVIGSIGVRCALIDDSERDAAQGIKEYAIVSDQSPNKVIDPAKAEDRARVREDLTAMAAVFIGDAARNRKVTPAAVEKDFGKGGVFIGKQAVSAGLADEAGDLEGVIASLRADDEKQRSNAMSGKNPSATLAEASCDGCGRAMDDDDETYCRACHSEASAVEREIAAITGKKTMAESRPIIEAWKQASEEASALRAQLSALKSESEAREFAAAVAEYEQKGILPPAADHKRRKYVASLQGKPDATAQLRLYCDTLDPLVTAQPAEQPKQEQPAAAVLNHEDAVPPLSALSADDRKMLAAAGYSAEKLVTDLATERAKRQAAAAAK